jgi:membrane associated rhomboid family serine protease
MTIRYNAPVVLTFSLLSIAVLVLTALAPALRAFFVLSPPFSFASPVSWLTLFTYVLGHAGAVHLAGNLSFILLVGPLVEEKYGSWPTLAMMAATAAVTAVLQVLLFPTDLLGASGIALMLILLGSLTNFKAGQIPLTFVLVALLFIGREVIEALKPDQISQFAHIVGGVCGGLFGLWLGPRK